MPIKRIFLFFFIGCCAISLPFSYLPPRFEVVESPNTTVTYSITMFSNKTSTEEVDVGLSTWEVSGNQFLFHPFTEGWVFLPTNHVSIPPDTVQKMEFSFQVPDIIGEKRFEISFISELAGASLRYSKSIPIFLVVSGTEIVKCSVVSFDILYEGSSLKAN